MPRTAAAAEDATGCCNGSIEHAGKAAVSEDKPTRKETVIKRSSLQSLLFVGASVLLSPAALSQESEDDAGAGKVAFNTSCRTCHSMKEGDNRLGPNLHNIVGREAGSAEYSYSPAMAGSDVVWDAETLDRFIENPEAVIPGNNMKPYGGISDDEVRASIVAHLSAASEDADGE